MARLRRNIIGNFYFTGAYIGTQLLLVPLYLHYWGAASYGAWLVLFTIPSFFAFTDAGLANTVGNAFTLALERGELHDAEAKLNAAWKYQALAWLVIFACFCTFLGFCPVQRWLGVDGIPAGVFVPTILLLCLGSLVWLQAGILSAIFRGARAYHSYLAWRGHTCVAEAVSVIAVLALGGGFVAVAFAMFLVRFLGAVALFIHGRALLPQLRPAIFSGKWSELVSMLPSGISFLSFPIANALTNQGTVLALIHLGGPAAIVLLSVVRQLTRVFAHGSSILMGALHPEMTIAYGSGDQPRIRRLQSVAVVVPGLAAGPYLLGLVLFGGMVVGWWTRKDLGVTRPLLLACGVEAISFGCTSLWSLVPWATNRIKMLSVMYWLGNIVALAAGIVLYAGIGLIAFPCAFALTQSVYCALALRRGARLGGFDFGSAFSVRGAFEMWRLSRAGRATAAQAAL